MSVKYYTQTIVDIVLNRIYCKNKAQETNLIYDRWYDQLELINSGSG